MNLEEKAYELISLWRRGEINGNQLEYKLQFLKISEEYCLQVTRKKDFFALKTLLYDFALCATSTVVILIYFMP